MLDALDDAHTMKDGNGDLIPCVIYFLTWLYVHAWSQDAWLIALPTPGCIVFTERSFTSPHAGVATTMITRVTTKGKHRRISTPPVKQGF